MYNAHGGISEVTEIFSSPTMRISNVAQLVIFVNLMEKTAGPSGRAFAVVRMLRMYVRIRQGAWTSVVSVVCCQAEVSASD